MTEKRRENEWNRKTWGNSIWWRIKRKRESALLILCLNSIQSWVRALWWRQRWFQSSFRQLPSLGCADYAIKAKRRKQIKNSSITMGEKCVRHTRDAARVLVCLSGPCLHGALSLFLSQPEKKHEKGCLMTAKVLPYSMWLPFLNVSHRRLLSVLWIAFPQANKYDFFYFDANEKMPCDERRQCALLRTRWTIIYRNFFQMTRSSTVTTIAAIPPYTILLSSEARFTKPFMTFLVAPVHQRTC